MFKIGETLKIRTFGGKVVDRTLVDEAHGRVYVCTEVEFAAAARENREPLSLGFPSVDVVQNADRSDEAE